MAGSSSGTYRRKPHTPISCSFSQLLFHIGMKRICSLPRSVVEVQSVSNGDDGLALTAQCLKEGCGSDVAKGR